MSKQRPYISQQIRKYLNGELDGPAMHQLEREALNDPFLAEALEGYGNAGADQQENLGDIHQRLQDRVNEKSRRRIVMWRTVSIAASVLVLLTIGGLWLRYDQSAVKTKGFARNETVEKSALSPDSVSPVKSVPLKTIAETPVPKHLKHISKESITPFASAADAGAEVPPSVSEVNSDEVNDKVIASAKFRKDTTPLDEVVVIGYAAQKGKDVTASVATISADSIPGKQLNAQIGLAGKVSGLQVNITKNSYFNTGDASGRKEKRAFKSISGIVTDKNDGTPIPGVTVLVKGSETGVQTNSAGKFMLSAPDSAVLQFRYIGYLAQEIPVHKGDLLAVDMQPTTHQEGEVAVTGALGVKRAAKELGYSTATISSTGLKRAITGVVTDKSDGTPIPGVTVKIKGTQTGVQTNSAGEYAINVPSGATLEFQFIGYSTVDIPAKDKMIAVALQPSTNSLAEVVVTQAYGQQAKDGEYQPTRPVRGWVEFRAYLKDNALSPDGKTGTVKLSFTVEADGGLNNFKVIKGISAQTDSAAVNLVRNGPRWIINSNKKPEKIKIKIKFGAKKQ